MKQFVIEDGILKAYFGCDKIVIVPSGVRQIGGDLRIESQDYPKELRGDPIGYKAFFKNQIIEELYLPDSVEVIGFKALEHCKNLRILSFSEKMKTVECNGLLGCSNLKTILYRGSVYDFTCLSLRGHLDLDRVICTDGVIQLHRECYIDTLHFPGTREEWEKDHKTDWRNKRAGRIVCADEENDE